MDNIINAVDRVLDKHNVKGDNMLTINDLPETMRRYLDVIEQQRTTLQRDENADLEELHMLQNERALDVIEDLLQLFGELGRILNRPTNSPNHPA